MTCLEKNMEALSQRYPLLADSLKNLDSANLPFAIEPSRSGHPTMRVNGQYIHSRFDPVQESRKFIASEVDRKAGLILAAGFGLGYHVGALHETLEGIPIVVVEPDATLFLLSLMHRDLTPLINSERIVLLIGTGPEDCLAALEQHPGKLIQLVLPRSLNGTNPEFYGQLEKTVKNYVSRREVNLSTLKRFGRLWIKNLSENAHLLSRHPGVNRLEGHFSDIPALMIAAGPSLDGLKRHLPELRDRFLIVTVDTALRACHKEGIEPDFTVVADPQYWNSRHLDHCGTNGTILISDTSTYPSVYRVIDGPAFLCSSPFPLGLFLESRTELKGKLKAGGSVATAAWDFCRTIGSAEIWCAGLDLGFPDKQTHSRGSFFEQRAHWLSTRTLPSENQSWHALIDAGLERAEANGGGVTWTDKRMSLYIRWFEEQMTRFPALSTWNLSEKGVMIGGMKGKGLEEALSMPIIRDRIESKLTEALNIKTDRMLEKKLVSALEELLSEFEILGTLSSEGLRLTKSLERSFLKGEDLSPILKDLSDLDNQILNRSGKDIAGFILQNFIKDLLGGPQSPEASEIIGNSLKLYGELNDSIVFHLDHLKKSQKNLKKIQE